VAFNPDGKTFLTASDDGTARLWDTATARPIGLPLLHQGPVVAVAFQPDGRALLTVSSDNTVKLWDADPGQPFGLVFERSEDAAFGSFSPDGRSVLAGAQSRAFLWDTVTGRTIGPALRVGSPLRTTLGFARDGMTVLTGSDQGAQLWDSTTGKPIGSPIRHRGPVNTMRFSPDGKTVLTGSEDRTIRFWDAATGTPLGEPIPQPGTVDAVAFSPDGKAFLVGCDNGAVQLWDTGTRARVGEPFPHPGAVEIVAFSPDCKSFLTGCEDGLVRLWDRATGELRVPPLRHQNWVFSAAFSPDGRTVLTGSRDRTVRLWDAATGQPIGSAIPHPTQATNVAFSPDGKLFLAGGQRLFRRVPELPDDLERVATWVEVLTGLRLEVKLGTIQVLDNAAWRGACERLRELGGPPETRTDEGLDPFPLNTDPTARARALMGRGQWDQAASAFDEVIRARPYNASSWLARGRFYSARGWRERAVADFTAAIATDPDDAQIHYQVALEQLLADDLTGYRSTCAGMMGRFTGSGDPYIAARVAHACVCAPDAVEGTAGLIRVAEESVSANPGSERVVGVAFYRAGRHRDALGRFARAHKVLAPRAWDRLFLAMIYARLCRADDAGRMLDLADRWIAEADASSGWSDPYERPTTLILRREAEAVVRPDSTFPADPFAGP
jgi:WD40 repeat protein/tetratricopeptide (TPR) repeat protein